MQGGSPPSPSLSPSLSRSASPLSPGGSAAAGSALVRRAVDINYANSKRASSLRWSALNAALLLLFAYDLSCRCAGYMSFLHYAELALAGVLCANLVQHARRLAPGPARAAPAALSPRQRRLLGLRDAPPDSEFRSVEEEAAGGPEEAASLSPRRTWRAGTDSPPRGAGSAPASPPSPPSPPSPAGAGGAGGAGEGDRFISDRRALASYLRRWAERERRAEPDPPAPPGPPRAAPRYQLAAPRHESEREEGAPGAGGAAAGAGGADDSPGAPRVWLTLHVDPQRLTQFNLNLRLWLQVTILERVVRELDAAEAALARLGLAALRPGEVGLERLRSLAAGSAPPAAQLRALLPFLEPFPDQRYLVRRIRELARGGCLSEYRWCGGGPGWDEGRPTDAELVLALLSAYLDGVLPQPPARPFSSVYVSRAPAPPPRLGVHRTARHPPHFALALHGAALDVPRGRNNLLHALLLLLAAAAARSPPALGRMHLGRAGLNMLWIIGR